MTFFSVKNLEKTIHVCVTVRVSADINEKMSYNTAETLLPESRRGWKHVSLRETKMNDFCDTFMESGFSPVDT